MSFRLKGRRSRTEMEKSGCEGDLCSTHSKTLGQRVRETSWPRYPLETANVRPTRGEISPLRCAPVEMTVAGDCALGETTDAGDCALGEMTRGLRRNRIRHDILATPHRRQERFRG